MNHPLRSVRDVIGVGFVWAIGWALVGALIEATHDAVPGGLPIGSLVDIWVPTLALPGLVAGVIVAAALQISGARAFIDLIAPLRSSLWGAAGGLLAGAILIAIMAMSATLEPLWLWSTTIVAVTALLGVASALGTTLWFRYAAAERAATG